MAEIRSRICLLFVGLAVAGLPAAAASDPVAVLGDVDSAREFDYCAWAFSDAGSAPDLSRITALVEDDAPGTEAERASAVLIGAGIAVARATGSEKACAREFDRGGRLFDGTLSKMKKRSSERKGSDGSADDPQIAAVQRRLSALWVDDQALRHACIRLKTVATTGSSFWARRLCVSHAIMADAASTVALRELLERYDWIDAHRFGTRISNHAWILVQHADDHRELQAEVLARMEPYLDNGGVSRSNYAYLFDRVAVNHGREQRYGTQPLWDCTDDGLELAPLEQPETVNERRAAMGLGSVEDALAEMSRTVCGN